MGVCLGRTQVLPRLVQRCRFAPAILGRYLPFWGTGCLRCPCRSQGFLHLLGWHSHMTGSRIATPRELRYGDLVIPDRPSRAVAPLRGGRKNSPTSLLSSPLHPLIRQRWLVRLPWLDSAPLMLIVPRSFHLWSRAQRLGRLPFS